MRLAIRLRVAHLLGGPTRDQKAVRTIYIIIHIYIYTDSEIIVLTRWGSLRLAPIIKLLSRKPLFSQGDSLHSQLISAERNGTHGRPSPHCAYDQCSTKFVIFENKMFSWSVNHEIAKISCSTTFPVPW